MHGEGLNTRTLGSKENSIEENKKNALAKDRTHALARENKRNSQCASQDRTRVSQVKEPHETQRLRHKP